MKKLTQLNYTNTPGTAQSAKFLIKAVLRKIFMPKRFIILHDIKFKDDYTLVYDYSVSDSMKNYFRPEDEFFIRYDFKINKIPKSILAIPFMANVMPIAWITDSTLFALEVDSEFARNTENMKKAFQTAQPRLDFRGGVKISKPVKNNYELSDNVAMGFSGGVDSFQTFTAHFKENPRLITLIGSDIFFDDKDGIKSLINNTKTIAEKYNLSHRIVKTNFRGFLNEGELDKITLPKVNDGYWHAVQHGIGLIGNIAPIAYQDRLRTFYFSSTFTKEEFEKRVSCSSWPITDESVRLSKCRVIHDGFEFNRQQKVRNIVEFSRKHDYVPLRVCWQSRGGKNCSRCEKCFRTMVALIAECENPNNYGFNYTKNLSKNIREVIGNGSKIKEDKVLAPLWRAIRWRAISRHATKNRKCIEKKYPELSWFLEEKI